MLLAYQMAWPLSKVWDGGPSGSKPGPETCPEQDTGAAGPKGPGRSHGRIEFNGAEYFIRRKLEWQYVVATLSTHHKRVFIKHEGKLIKSVPFPYVGKPIDPLC